jgi:glycosyltransferase involved in cell wall biosynthesis
MRVALIHDWLVSMRGGERVLEAFCELFPDADVFTLVHKKGACSTAIESMRIHTSFVDRLPLAKKHHRHYLPLFPHAIEGFDLNGYDLVLSSSHCVAKGVITPPSAVHISYVHTPMRYIWDQYPDYFGPGRVGALTGLAARACATFLRTWDEASASRVDVYLANSYNVAARVEKRYRREAEVVHPPVQLSRFSALPAAQVGDYYLMVTAFAPYKRVDLAIEAFRSMGKPLKIVGAGQDAAKIRALVAPPVELLATQSEREIEELYRRARALIFPGEEDAGITPLEAQASGRPVIALGRGGVLETVVGLGGAQGSEPTGVFFEDPTVEALIGAVQRFESNFERFDPAVARRNAERFDVRHFKARIAAVVDRALRAREFLRRSEANVADSVH